jgi:D-alanyl-D-alanine carboxypeptidase
VLTWDQSLATGEGLLSSQTQTERPRTVPGPAGYGLAIACVDGWVGHTGDISGYDTAAFYDTNSATSAIVETNSDVPSGNWQVEQTLTDEPGEAVSGAPATRMFVPCPLPWAHGLPACPNDLRSPQ